MNEGKRTITMLDDIFTNNEQRLCDLRKKYSADTVASMLNEIAWRQKESKRR